MIDEEPNFAHDLEYKDLARSSRNLTRSGRFFCETLVRWLSDGWYKRHYDVDKGRYFECSSFAEFMEAQPRKGLGLDPEKVKEELEILSPKIPEARRILAAWFKDRDGLAEHGEIGGGHSRVDNINSETQGGTSVTYTLRRLARDRPDLLARVESGELSANAAAVEAGFRRSSLQLSTGTDPETAAQKIREKFGSDYATLLKEAL